MKPQTVRHINLERTHPAPSLEVVKLMTDKKEEEKKTSIVNTQIRTNPLTISLGKLLRIAAV